MAAETMTSPKAMPSSFFTRQRLPASDIRIIDPARETRVALAVFSSEGCRICGDLKPAVAVVASDPTVAVRVFDEHADAQAWDALSVPGSPYAVAIDLDGTVRAKGTFNNLAQLESVIATAQRRAQPYVHA